MSRIFLSVVVFLLGCLSPARAQEIEPAMTPDSAVSPPLASPSPGAPARKVRVSFLPPPLEGTITLGIFTADGRLVRILHREARIEDFTAGDDALITFWDGKSDNGEDQPAGKYRARGMTVAEEIRPQPLGRFFEDPSPSITPSPSPPSADSPPEPSGPEPTSAPPQSRGAFTVEDGRPVLIPTAGKAAPPEKISVRLMANPLENDARATIELNVRWSELGCWLQTVDGLPLRTITANRLVNRAVLWKVSDRVLDVFQEEPAAITQVRLPNLDQMMRFDCGAFDLK